jgi:hypothetical protein
MAYTTAGYYSETFRDSSDHPLPDTPVTVYGPGSTLAALYSDRGKTQPLANPFRTDGSAFGAFYADPGQYWRYAGGVARILNVPIDPVEAAQDSDLSAYPPLSLVTAKGDLLVATAAASLARLAVGARGQVLVPDPSMAAGVKWAFLSALGHAFNVRDYGAVGNGVTDDAAAIQAASAAAAAVSGTVFFPPGTYLSGSTLTIASDSVRWQGSGYQITTIKGPDGSIVLDVGNGTSQNHYIALADLTLTRQTAGGAITVRLRKQDQVRIDNCSIAGGTTCLDMSQCIASVVSGCGIYSQTAYAVRVDNSDQVAFNANLFETNFSSTATHFRVESGNKSITIDGNIMSTGQYAIFADGGPSNDITVTGNNVENCDNGFFIAPLGASASKRWTIVGNTLRGKAAGGSEGVRLYGADNVVVGNTITNYTTSVNESGAGAANNLVVGNRVDASINVTSAGSVVGPNLGSGAITVAGDISGGDLIAGAAGKGLKVKEGSNAKMGTATLVAGTATVATTAATATSRILLTTQSLGTVTAAKPIAVTARTAGTSFTITSADATDTSVVAWMLVEPA